MKYYLHIVHYFFFKNSYLPVSASGFNPFDKRGVVKLGELHVWIQIVPGEDLTRHVGRSVLQPRMRCGVVQYLATEFVGNISVARCKACFFDAGKQH